MSAVAARGRKPTAEDVAYARRLAEGEWGLTSIHRLMRHRDIAVSESTVLEWIDPEYAERRREDGRRRGREREARRRRLSTEPWLRRDATVEYRMVRLEALARIGLPRARIGAVLGLDFGTPLTEHEVARALATGTPPRRWRQPIAARRTA